MLWLYMHFPDLPLEAMAMVSHQQPVALTDKEQRGIQMANETALAQGITPGMAIATAYGLCPELWIEQRQAKKERQKLESIAQWAGTYAAQICLMGEQGILLEVGSMLPYFGGLSAMETHIRADLQQLTSRALLATGYTPLSARWLAESGCDSCTETREQMEKTVRALPIAITGWSEKSQRQLSGMGIRTLGQLMDLPIKAIGQHLGASVLDQVQRLSGVKADPPKVWQAAEQFVQSVEFWHEVEHIQGVLFPLQPVLQAMCLFLRRRQQHALRIRLTLCLAGEEQDFAIDIGHRLGSDDLALWRHLIELKLQKYLLSSPVRGLKLSTLELQNWQGENIDLFDSRAQGRREFDLFISRIQARLGEQSVKQLDWVADHRPERAWRGESPLHVVSRSASSDITSLPRRPTWLQTSPAAIQKNHFTLLQGPERLVSGWWDDFPIRRDYYIAQSRDQRLAWIFRNDQGEWFVHGWFG